MTPSYLSASSSSFSSSLSASSDEEAKKGTCIESDNPIVQKMEKRDNLMKSVEVICRKHGFYFVNPTNMFRDHRRTGSGLLIHLPNKPDVIQSDLAHYNNSFGHHHFLLFFLEELQRNYNDFKTKQTKKPVECNEKKDVKQD